MLGLNTTILLVEDDQNDVLFLKLALEAVGVQNRVIEAKDGREAMEYLRGAGAFANRQEFPLPYLVFLDLKLPHVMGLELLKWIRERTEFDSMILIVLTSSANPADVDNAYRLGANAYVVKPTGFEKLQVLARSIKDFWLVQNRLGKPFYEE